MMKKLWIGCAGMFLLFSALAPACKGKAGLDTVPPKREPKPVVGTQEVKGTPIAYVGDSVITVEQIQKRLDRVPPYYKARYASKKGKRELLDNLIEQELLYRKGLEYGFDKDEALLERLETMKKKLVIQRLIQDVVQKDISVSDEEVKRYYEEHPDEFKVPEKVHVSMILVRVDPNAGEEEVAKARAKAEDLLRQLKEGADFAELARNHSDDPSARRGGDLRWVHRGRMPKAFEDVAFSLEPGTLSDVFQTPQGFHIIQVHEKTPEEVRPFDRVKRLISRKLLQEKKRKALAEFKEQLRKQTKIAIEEERLDDIVVSSAPPRRTGNDSEEAPVRRLQLTPEEQAKLREKARELMERRKKKLLDAAGAQGTPEGKAPKEEKGDDGAGGEE